MILRKLEVYGFKSFADRQTFHFAPGITAIIGPNGCGKSNIVDAFKWVLGEQAPSSLRSKGMTDVLHLDREGKEAVAYAEGSITFDNTSGLLHYDAPEVVVTRRIHRDGHGEYLINNRPVRLRTLRDLFLGTGIGTRSYFVLEQGRITDIIKRSPVERRVIFEEAAGIGRYNQRRREAERKLQAVDDSLRRAHDVIGEISRQIRSLRIQAGRARSYNETAARLGEVRIQAGALRYLELVADVNAVARRLEAEADEEEQARVAERTAAARREAGDRLRQSAAEAVHRYRAAVHDNEARIQAAREAIAGETDRAAQARAEAADRRAEAERIEAALEAFRRELAELDQGHREAVRARRVFGTLRYRKAAELEDAAEAYRAVVEELDELRREGYERDRRRAELTNQSSALRVRAGSLEGGLERLRRRRHELDAQRARLAAERTSAEGRSASLGSTLAEARQALHEAERAQREARRELADLERQLAEERVNLRERHGRLAVLKDLEAAREGMGAGARYLLGRAAPQGSGSPAPDGVLGCLADALEVDPAYARAVEKALGDDAEALLTVDAGGALAAADTLKQQRKGGAVFWPVEAPVGAPPARAEGFGRGHTGFVGWAPELVQVRDPRFRGALELLADVVVVDSRAAALALRPEAIARGVRLVTLEGEIFGPLARIAAGESVRAAGLISRRAEVQRLEREIADSGRRVAALEAQRAGLQGRSDESERALAQAHEQLRDRDLDRARHLKEVDELCSRERDLEEERRIGEEEAAEMGRELEALRAEERDVAAAIAAEQRRLEAIQARERWLATERGAAGRRLGGMRSEVERIEAVSVATGRRETELHYRKHQMLERISEMDHGRARRREEAHDREAAAGAGAERIRELEARLEGLGAEGVRWERLLAQAEQALQDAAADHGAALCAEEEARAALDRVRQVRAEDRIREGQLRTRLEALVERLEEEAGIDLVAHAAAGGAPAGAADLEALEEEAAQLKRKLDRLGPVNAAAIGELADLERRERFYLEQEQDLVASKRVLEDIIRRINRRSRQIFLETFNAVRAEFRAIFRKLFGGGRGDIRLLDEDNVLESGVEILAQPPEKGAKSIDMLSGGEKVMTTTALLFAIFTARPSPFCLLDEIDAALDEANIQRFLDMVSGFVARTQFIIVTHNKRTIAEADVLHGITMPKAGRSQRISVKLENHEVRPAGRTLPAALAAGRA
ncbi:MAG: chromosome segregation protein SMC [Planctomycetes bacterium]|nr:chromosome segregation protein SMC [Planctomycetota bacterium]